MLGDGEVLIGDGAAGDLGVAQGHVQAAVAEHRGDRLQAHAAVDRLGGQRVPELVGVDVGQPGGGAGLVDVAGDGVPVGRLAVLPGQQQRVGRVDVRGAVLVDQGDQVRVQRQVAVLAELADRDVQPRPGADLHHGISAQGGVLADPQPGAQQHLHGDAHEQALVVLRGAQQLRGAGVVEGLGQRVVLAGQVAGEHRHPGRGLVPAPFVEADEEHPQRAEPVGDGGRGQPRLVLPGPGGEPGLVVLDVTAGDLRDAGHLGRGLGQERGEGAQCQVGAADAARPQHAADLGQVAAHRGGDLRDGGLQVGPARQRAHPVDAQRRPAHRRLPVSAPGPAGWPAKTCASITSAALRYWAASQSSARCR